MNLIDFFYFILKFFIAKKIFLNETFNMKHYHWPYIFKPNMAEYLIS